MRRGLIIHSFLVAAVLVNLPHGAWSYPYSGVDDPSARPGMYSLGRNAELSQFQNPANSFAAVSPLEETFNSGVGRSLNPNLWCTNPNGNCNESGGGATEVRVPSPGFRKAPVLSLAPMSGFQAVMNSMAYSNQAANALVSPVTLMNVAMQLTEPGISAGLAMALNHVNQALQNRYLANQAFLANANTTPEGKLAVRSYQSCMRQKMDTPSNAQSWVGADAACAGGETINNSSSVQPFNDIPTGAFDFSHALEHQLSPENAGASNLPNRAADRILLTDYLFNNEGFIDPEYREEFRTSFIEAIGDVGFQIRPGNNGARLITHNRIVPTRPPEQLFREHTLVAYHLIHEILFKKCEAINNYGSGPGSSGDIYAGGQIQELMERLAVPGYMTTRVVLEAFYREFLESIGRVRSGRPQNCDELRSWEGGSRATSIETLSNSGSWSTSTSRLTRLVFSYAQLIGRLKTLNTYLIAEQVVQKLTVSSFEGTLRQLAFDAIYDVAGTRDIQREYDLTLGRLRELGEAITSENRDRTRVR